jgi:hypothetical protein
MTLARYNSAVARYRILHWRGIPSFVEAFEDERVVRRPLSARFQELIDAVAMREGASDTEAYLEGWDQGPELERAGDAETVAETVVAELETTIAELTAKRLSRGIEC